MIVFIVGAVVGAAVALVGFSLGAASHEADRLEGRE